MNHKNTIVSIFSLAILSLVIFTSSVLAGDEPPVNDNLANATPIVINNGTGSITTVNNNATKEAGEPNHAENAGGKSVWFAFTPTATKAFRINTTNTTFDTLLAVYTGNAMGNLQLVGYNNDCSSVCGGASSVDLMMSAGTTYYIAVDGVNNDGSVEQGNFKIALLEYDAPIHDNFNSPHELGLSYKGSIAGTNYSATVEPNEPGAYYSSNPNGKSVWYRWTSSDTYSVTFEVTDNFDSQIGVFTSNVASPTFAQLTNVAANADYNGYSNRYRTRFFAETGRTYYIKIDGHTAYNPQVQVGNFQLKFYASRLSYWTDRSTFTEKAAISVFRPTEGKWYSLTWLNQPSPNLWNWGLNGDTPIAADFVGDGFSRYAAVRNQNGQKIWYISISGSVSKVIPWGLASDKAITGDFDRDGIADLGAIRNSANGYLWYIRQSRDASMRVFNFGTTGDRPILGDFDGDGYTEVSVLRNTQNGLVWYMLRSSYGNGIMYTKFDAIPFGLSTDVPAAEDFDGDGKTDIAVFRPSTATWYILRSGTGELQVTPFGASGDKPQPADYDGDGRADLALFRPTEGNWYFWLSGTNTQEVVHWGVSTDIPVSSLSTLSQ